MPVHLPPDLMVSVSGFRGRVMGTFTPELATSLAASYGTFLRQEGEGDRLLVGRDSRTSGPILVRAAVAGLLSAGCRVTELGLVPTPTALMATADADAAGAIVVTASHNPADWNAFKFGVRGGTFLPAERMVAFRSFLREQEPERCAWDEIHLAEQDGGAVERHLARILALPYLDVEAIRALEFPVMVDCVRGAGGVIIPELLRRLGCRWSAIGATPNGRFPRDPEPTAGNLKILTQMVMEKGARVGFAVDPDVDRLSLVDERGRALGEDLTLALAADVVLRREVGPVVTNLSTSQVVEDVARRYGAPVVRAAVGEINVASRMMSEGAVVGGEGNGGVIVPALHHTRDAAAGVVLLLQCLADEPGISLSERVRELPSYQIVKEKFAFDRRKLAGAYAALERSAGEGTIDRSDGIRIAWPGDRSWLHVRPSGTEPVVRLIAEAPTAEVANRLVQQARQSLAEL